MVFQAYSLFPNLTVAENVAFGLRVRGRDKAERAGRAAELLDLVGLADRGDALPAPALRRPAAAGGPGPGPRRRAAGAAARRAAVGARRAGPGPAPRGDPPDPAGARHHDASSSPTTRPRRCRWPTGSASCAPAGWSRCASPDELYERPATAFVAEFVGTMNRVPATLADGEVQLLGTRRPVDRRAPPPGPVVALVRPEALLVTAGRRAGAGRVVTRTFSGASPGSWSACPTASRCGSTSPARSAPSSPRAPRCR